MADWRDEIETRVRGQVVRDAPLAKRTAIRVGGPADLFVRPADPDDLAALLRACRELQVPSLVLGGGTNLLVADRGVRGVVLKLPPSFGAEDVRGTRLVLSAGAPTNRLVVRAGDLGLVGCEYAAGIPGSLGGAVAMNAGTPSGEMKDILRQVEIATADGSGFVPAASLELGYRTARLPCGGVVTRLEVELREGDIAASAAQMKAEVDHRRATQPLDRPTFGSTFRNPPGDHAGRLIEAVGLKGHRVGNAAWSGVHANFVVNLGGASARDVLALVNLARSRVKEEFGITLEPEVRLAGEFLADEGVG
jgi:UDP-N-acetylmuramate dehydrogenase